MAIRFAILVVCLAGLGAATCGAAEPFAVPPAPTAIAPPSDAPTNGYFKISTEVSSGGTEKQAAETQAPSPYLWHEIPDTAKFKNTSIVPGTFCRRPIITEITGDEPEQACPTLPAGCRQALFSGAANFPYNGFTRDGIPIPHEAFLIYEGMSVSVAPDGRYTVFCTVEAPKMPVTVRLQLHLHQHGNHQATITLPPMTFPFDLSDDVQPDRDSRSYRVLFTGYSPRLITVAKRDDPSFDLTRSGSARFGSVPK